MSRANGKNASAIRTILKSAHLQSFRSLRDVKLQFKPLTIIVGPNSSGKSNCLDALALMNRMMSVPEPPPRNYVQPLLWAENAREIVYELSVDSGSHSACYTVAVGLARKPGPILRESLVVDGTEVIRVSRGKGTVYNEDGSHPVLYNGAHLALKSAGLYGDRPVTNVVAEFVRQWNFYDVDPNYIRLERLSFPSISDQLDMKGGTLPSLLYQWASRDPLVLASINEGMVSCGGTELEISGRKLHLLEGLSRSLPLDRASDGTLRLLFYHALLHQPNMPTLIGIEEPERNLHPAALPQVGRLLEQLAQKTQVVFTTHSSQLLDCFAPDSLSGDLAILLLRKRPGTGTEALSLEDLQADRGAVHDWMNDFGIGNAIFHSQLLQDITGS